MKPKISVVLPVFNAVSAIRTAMDSILNQSYSDFEVLIVDDGSTDGSREVIKGCNDQRIRFYPREHFGLSASLNYGIKQSKGEFIARMDADDISINDRLALQVQYLETHQESDLVATQVTYKGLKTNEGLRHYVDWQNLLTDHSEMYLNRFVDSPIVHPSIMVRRSSFDKFGYYSSNKGPEDFELWLRWLNQGARFHKLNKELIIWNDSPSRLTRVHANYHQSKFHKIKACYFAKWIHEKSDIDKVEIWIIGLGRQIFQRTQWLSKYGLEIAGFVDFKAKSSPTRKIISYDQLSSIKNPFFLSYVNDRNGRQKIHEFLSNSGYVEGSDFYMMA